MAQNTLPNNMNNTHRLSSKVVPTNNQIAQNLYEFELMKLMEQERQMIANQVNYSSLIDLFLFLCLKFFSNN